MKHTPSLGTLVPKGWVLYDGACSFCTRWIKRWERTLTRRGYAVTPLQEAWVGPKLGLPPELLLHDFRLLLADGRTFAGAEAYLFLARQIWWTWPIFALFSLPLFHGLFRGGYRWIANNRKCSRTCAAHPDGKEP